MYIILQKYDAISLVVNVMIICQQVFPTCKFSSEASEELGEFSYVPLLCSLSLQTYNIQLDHVIDWTLSENIKFHLLVCFKRMNHRAKITGSKSAKTHPMPCRTFSLQLSCFGNQQDLLWIQLNLPQNLFCTWWTLYYCLNCGEGTFMGSWWFLLQQPIHSWKPEIMINSLDKHSWS